MNSKHLVEKIDLPARMERIVEVFVFSAGVVLLFTAIAKIVSATGTSSVLQVRDSLILVSFRSVFIVVGFAELIVSGICIFGRKLLLQNTLIAWLATSFLIYRFGLSWIGYTRPCPCLGSLTSALHISSQTAESVLIKILAYLLVGSYAALLWLWTRKMQIEPVRSSSILQKAKGS